MAELTALAGKLLEVPQHLIASAIALELTEGTVVASAMGGTACSFLAGLFHSERGIAERLRSLVTEPLPWSAIDAGKALPWIEGRTGLSLAPSRVEAIRLTLRSKVLVITGGPGVGRTTLVNSVLRVLGAKGDASLRSHRARGQAHGGGHRTGGPHYSPPLETYPTTGGFGCHAEGPLDCDLLVVDESSMVDVPLMRALLRAVPEEAALLLVGDVDQPPSGGRARPWPTSSAHGRCRWCA